MSEENEFRMLVRFPDQSPSFAYGFEAGTIWTDMIEGREIRDRAVNEHNRAVIEEMANARGYDIQRLEPSEVPGWLWLTAVPAPKGFRVHEGGKGK